MKVLKTMIANTFCTFSVLSLLMGILCKANILVELPYSNAVFPLFFMSIGTTLFVTVREIVMPDSAKLKYLIDITGCSAVILLIGHFVGWLEMSMSYFLMICAMVLIVYVLVWFLTWLQSKHDEEELNRLLVKQLDEQKDQDK